jgi:phosphohistidine phosphatase SixA
MRDQLHATERDVLLVGHMPHIAALALSLSRDRRDFPLNGLIAFRKSADGGWVEEKVLSSDLSG